MTVAKKNLNPAEGPITLGRMSWITDELVGIRTLEERVSRKLKSPGPQDSRFLLDHIQNLNLRVEMLNRALDEYTSSISLT